GLAAEAVLAKRVVQAHLQIRRLAAPADDQRAGKLIRAGGKLLRPRAGNDDRTGRHEAAMLDRLVAGHVDDRDRRGQRHIRPDHGARSDSYAFGQDRARPDKRSVFDDDRTRTGRFEHATDPDAAREMDICTDLRTRSDGRPSVDHRAWTDP